MMKIDVMWFTALTLVLIFGVLIQLISKSMKSDKEGASAFECGFNMMNPPHIPFSFQFFLIALLFLIFDVEIALVLSYPMEPTSLKKMILIMGFISILLIGLIYEWQKSKIHWSKWMGKTSLQEDAVK